MDFPDQYADTFDGTFVIRKCVDEIIKTTDPDGYVIKFCEETTDETLPEPVTTTTYNHLFVSQAWIEYIKNTVLA